MARARDAARDESRKIYLASSGKMLLKDIAEQLGKSPEQIRKWKNQDKWDDHLKGNVTNRTKGNVTNDKDDVQGVESSMKGVRKRGGNPNPTNQFTERNQVARKHGLFSRYIPQETLELMGMLDDKSPTDLIWDQIQIQYAAIIRSQAIMFVTGKDEMIKEIKKERFELMEDGPERTEVEYEFQFSWERQTQFLNAQSRALSELRTSIKQFVSMAAEDDERRLKLEQMQLNIDKSKVELDTLRKNDENQLATVIFVDNIPRGNV